MRFKRVTVIAGGCLGAAAATLALTGGVVLFDPHQYVASAQLIDGQGHSQPLLNLDYLRIGVPRIEGAVRITCKDGKVIELGYVTPGARTWLKIDGAIGCSTGHL